MNPAIIACFVVDVCRNERQTIRVVEIEKDEDELAYGMRVEKEAAQLACQYGEDVYIYGPNSIVRIPVEIEEIA